ncbi:MAG: ArnT family glycosyltransferase [Acidimicrobiia bacterium]
MRTDRWSPTPSGPVDAGARRIARVGVTGFAVVGLLLRLAVWFRPLATLDRLFIPDDTYYTLTIARSIAHGHGPTADGTTLTSGFQALHGFLMVPVFWLTDNHDAAVRVDLALLVLADVLTIVVLGWIAYRLAGSTAAVIAAGIWALSPIALSMALGGLETSLAIAAEVTLVALWIRADDQPAAARWALVGIASGLAVLARVDAILLVALLVLVEVWRGEWRRLGPAAIAGAVVVGPWWTWCLLNLGTPFPTSGAAAHAVVHGREFAATTFATAAGAVTGGPFASPESFRSYLVSHSTVGIAVYFVVVAVLATVGIAWLRSGASRRDPVRRPSPTNAAATLPVFAIGLLGFYVWFGVTWYLSRYLAPVAAIVTLIVAVAAAHALRWSTAEARRPAVALAVVAGLMTVVAIGIGGDEHALTAATRTPTLLDAVTGFGRVGKQASAAIPCGATAGAWQSGAIGYYGSGRIRVVNLDGVVNPEAPIGDPAATARYIRDRHITWLADWDTILESWLFVGRKRIHPTPRVRKVLSIDRAGGAAVGAGYGVIQILPRAPEPAKREPVRSRNPLCPS